ncbi:MAG: cyclic pyranopterin monophosphate synthase MoaC [Desulfuromonas sp.]|nr:MAG: cyclic pyranopterin monophosphate synthase MoaC [Desulfuromonas sp.]
MGFNHFDAAGQAIMVDVSQKAASDRIATAQARIRMQPETLEQILQGSAKKGDVLGVARLAGIAAAKKTPDLIPLSHPLALHAVNVDFEIVADEPVILIQARVRAVERTGVEMEAMTAASVAALTLYDMCKGVDRSMIIEEICLLYKAGGKSGTYERSKSDV